MLHESSVMSLRKMELLESVRKVKLTRLNSLALDRNFKAGLAVKKVTYPRSTLDS